MKTLLSIFAEKSGIFSWRKAGTAIVFLIFAFACIGYGFKHNFDELPASYLSIISGVFAFYFFKDVINRLSISGTDKK